MLTEVLDTHEEQRVRCIFRVCARPKIKEREDTGRGRESWDLEEEGEQHTEGEDVNSRAGMGSMLLAGRSDITDQAQNPSHGHASILGQLWASPHLFPLSEGSLSFLV